MGPIPLESAPGSGRSRAMFRCRRRFACLAALALALAACAPQALPARAPVLDPRPLCAKDPAPPPAMLQPPARPSVVSASPPCPSCGPPSAPELPSPTGTIAVSSQPRSIRAHFPGPDEPYRDCQAHPWVVRTVPAGVNPVEVAVRAVIAGPTPFEEQQGLFSPFRASTNDPGVRPLSPSRVSVKVKNGEAIVDFPADAAAYLNQAACAQASVTSAIRFTLLQFREIHSVTFTIGGVVNENGDA